MGKNNNYIPKVGDVLTKDGDSVTIGGHLTIENGAKVVVTQVEMSKGYWSRLCPDIYVHPELRWVKVRGHNSTCWLPNAFVETK